MDYRTDRARRIAAGPTGKPMLNNTGHSRQVRRARQREAEKGPVISEQLQRALAQLEDGMGLFHYVVRSKFTGLRHKRYRVGYTSERQETHADYKGRYQALFPVSAG